MKIAPQNPLNSVFRAEIEAWRIASRMSKESVGGTVLEEHMRRGGDVPTGADFEFSGDFHDRVKKATQKLYRWLDDVAPLPLNMQPTLLAVLPMDHRLAVLNELLNQLGVDARPSETFEPADFDSRSHLSAVAKEGTEAVIALGQLDQNASPAEIENVVRECIEAENAARKAVRGARALLAKAKSTLRRAA